MICMGRRCDAGTTLATGEPVRPIVIPAKGA